jgi:hypothetical protein
MLLDTTGGQLLVFGVKGTSVSTDNRIRLINNLWYEVFVPSSI